MPYNASGLIPNQKFLFVKSPHVRESKTVLDSWFQAVDSGFQVLDQVFFSETFIPDSLSCIPDSKAQGSWSSIPHSTGKIFPDSVFHKQKFLGFRNPDSITYQK